MKRSRLPKANGSPPRPVYPDDYASGYSDSSDGYESDDECDWNSAPPKDTVKPNIKGDDTSSKRKGVEEVSDPKLGSFRKITKYDTKLAYSLPGKVPSAPVEKVNTLSPEQQSIIDACFSPKYHQRNRITHWSSPHHFGHKLLVQLFNANVEIEDIEVEKSLALLAELHFMPGGDENMDTYYAKKEEYWAVLEKGRKTTGCSEAADV